MLGPVGMLAHAVSEDIAARADKLRIFTAIFPRLIIDEALGQLEATPRGKLLRTDNNHPASGSNANSCPPVLAAALALPPAGYRWAARMAAQQPVRNHSLLDIRNNWPHNLQVDSRKKARNKGLSPSSLCHSPEIPFPAPDQIRPIRRRGGDGRGDDGHGGDGRGRHAPMRGCHESPRAGQGRLSISFFSFRASIP